MTRDSYSSNYKDMPYPITELYYQVIEQQEIQLDAIINSMSDGLFILDKNSNYSFLNQGGKDFFYQPETIAKNGDCFNDTHYFDVQGKELSVEDMVWSRVLKGEIVKQCTIRAVRPDKTTYFSISGNPVYDSKGNISSAVICCRDVTEQIESDLLIFRIEKELLESKEEALKNKMEKEMARLDKLSIVGTVAAGIGHEVRNAMTTVRGFLQLISSKEECSKYNDYFALMIDELDRANSIITEFLSLAKDRVVEFKVQSLKEIVETIFPLIQADGVVSDKYIHMDLEEVSEIPLDKKEIHQLILNLVLNGSQAMSPGGTIKIRTFMDKDEIVLSVEDDGKGIEPEVLGKMGTPFFTTKESGTGLGLAVCYSIVARHNARIDIETGSAGTTFFVRFKQVNSL